MSHDATSHDWLLDRFVGRLSWHITVTHTQRKWQQKCSYIGMIGLL